MMLFHNILSSMSYYAVFIHSSKLYFNFINEKPDVHFYHQQHFLISFLDSTPQEIKIEDDDVFVKPSKKVEFEVDDKKDAEEKPAM